MKHLNRNYYVETKDKRYIVHPIENTILKEKNKLFSLRTQNQVRNDTQIRRNQNALKDENI